MNINIWTLRKPKQIYYETILRTCSLRDVTKLKYEEINNTQNYNFSKERTLINEF